jgi:hypothetical protein
VVDRTGTPEAQAALEQVAIIKANTADSDWSEQEPEGKLRVILALDANNTEHELEHDAGELESI